MSKVTIRRAEQSDVGIILQYIIELAIFEKAEHEVLATEDSLRATLFGEQPAAQSLILEVDGAHVGFVVYFFSFSTWKGKKSLFLEDLYVSPTCRGQGVGKRALQHLAGIAKANDCGRFEWNVIDWNEPAMRFYETLGAKPVAEWVGYRLEETGIAALSEGA